MNFQASNSDYITTCSCVKTTVEKTITIECDECIDGYKRNSREPDCPCSEKTVNILVCEKCNSNRNKIQQLNIDLDDVLYNLSLEIREYNDITDILYRVKQISNQLRDYNRILLEHM